METLLDLADALAATGPEPECPDFLIPEEYSAIPTDYIRLGDSPGKGMGWFAIRDVPAGTLLMVVKPIAMMLDWQAPPSEEEDDDNNNNNAISAPTKKSTAAVVSNINSDADTMEDDDAAAPPEEEQEPEPRINELLLVLLLEKLRQEPTLWQDKLSTLYPRGDADLSALPAWVCADDSLFLQIEALLQQLEQSPQIGPAVAREISKRLPLIVRYNILSVETCCELLTYPSAGGHSSLSGVGVYHLPSFFNHSSKPNCSRWAVGDVMGVVTNQDIHAGQELFISYIEHDVLCESPHRRNVLLSMNFDDGRDEGTLLEGYTPDQGGPQIPVVDTDVQNELLAMDPFERLSAIEELMQQATGAKAPADEVEENGGERMETTGVPWFQCDIQNLRILKAITLEMLGQTRQALELWEEAVVFTETKMPPNDETSVVVRVQAALCSWHLGEHGRAKAHAAAALRTHHLLFGGSVQRFRRRYRAELQLAIRSGSGSHPNQVESSVERLWPVA